ncbi:hypothetical protein ACN47E_006442 [Coniothyrium glycines]
MADDPLIFDGDEAADPMIFEDDTNDIDFNDGGDEADYMNNGDAPGEPEDEDDDDFRLDDFDDSRLPTNGVQSDDEADKDYDNEDDAKGGSKKGKRARVTPGPAKCRPGPRPKLRADVDNGEPFILNEDTEFLNKPSSRVPGTFGRRNRRKGESLPAYHKRVSHELDSDDELIMQMREKGFSDRQIADKLAKDGRVRYDQKSISTRIMRIRLAQADNVDFLLKEGYKEWEFEDDCLLIQAHALADIEVSYEIERIRAWRFRKVSEYMRRLNKDALFSATACRERYNALISGTARIPSAMDDDPAARRAEMTAFRAAREHMRSTEDAAKAQQEADSRRQKDETRILNAQRAEETAQKRAAKEAEKAQRAMDRAAQAQIRAQRAAENQLAKTQRNAQIKQTKAARADTKAKAKPTTTKKKKEDEDEGGNTSSKPPQKRKRNADTSSSASHPPPPSPPPPPAPTHPYAALPLASLRTLCQDRGLATLNKDTHTLVRELRDADDEWSLADLRKMCRVKGLSVGRGGKAAMRDALAREAVGRFGGVGGQEGGMLGGGDGDGEEDEDGDVDMGME